MEKSEVSVGVWMRSYCSVEFYVASMLTTSDSWNIYFAEKHYDKCDRLCNQSYNDLFKLCLMGDEL